MSVNGEFASSIPNHQDSTSDWSCNNLVIDKVSMVFQVEDCNSNVQLSLSRIGNLGGPPPLTLACLFLLLVLSVDILSYSLLANKASSFSIFCFKINRFFFVHLIASISFSTSALSLFIVFCNCSVTYLCPYFTPYFATMLLLYHCTAMPLSLYLCFHSIFLLLLQPNLHLHNTISILHLSLILFLQRDLKNRIP